MLTFNFEKEGRWCSLQGNKYTTLKLVNPRQWYEPLWMGHAYRIILERRTKYINLFMYHTKYNIFYLLETCLLTTYIYEKM